GKSTLIKLLADRLQPMDGRVAKSGKLRVGYFAQHQSNELDLEATPFIELGRKRPDDLDHTIRAQLGRFGFSQERAETKVANLSGGEKARLLFALMTCDQPHILLLDEPTNHLDVESREALIQALNVYEGAVIIVSHDPHIIELTADRFWLIDEGRVRPYEGDLDDYRTLLLAGNGNGRPSGGIEGGARENGGGLNKKQRRQEAAARRQGLSALKKKLSNAEKTVHRLEKERNVLRQAMADPKLYEGGGDQPAVLQYQLGTLEKDLKSAEDAWEALLEEYEQGAA
ncbi:MAG: ATP-binding cassette domain-containing protein, partial [Rhodospirillales bacterium]|nr:ATP-binding cassette domain-containing protein [Rhodospirillales bacterium]